ncbi:MAG: nucleoside monophosphate kinase [Candidatus Moraniibacteriota bacterium]
MNLVILGPQGSGKDTQAEKLAKHFNLERVNMGNFLREVAKQDTPLGKEIYQYQNVTGTMVPSRILKEVLGIKLNSFFREQSVAFEGVPRTMEQAQYFDEAVRESGRKIDKVIFINLSKEEALKRISKRRVCKSCEKILIMGKDFDSEKEKCPDCGGEIVLRIDDADEVIAKRLKVFQDETIPVIDYYRKQKKLLEVDGAQSVEKVFEDILASLGGVA